MLKPFCRFLLLAGVALMASAHAESPFAMRAVHLDLARQMEPVSFVERYIDLVADAGFTSLKLYFEGRLRTPTTQILPDCECYSAEDIKRILAKAQSRNIEILPSIEALGHCEHFFREGSPIRHLSEERNGDGRWPVKSPTTFCPTMPESREFVARYLREVSAMFPAKSISVGMDETWHLGFCPLCAPRRAKIGFGGIFLDYVHFVHDTLAQCGKQMALSDDFFEFFPERLAECPKDAVFSHWMYDEYVSRWGHRGHFAQRIRRDLLADYRQLGIHALCNASFWYGYRNFRTFTEYAVSRGATDMLLSQWEMFDRGHGQYVPVMMAVGEYWKNPAKYAVRDFARVGLERCFPKLTEAQKDAIVPTMQIRLFLPQRTVTETLNLWPNALDLSCFESAIHAFRSSAYAPQNDIAPDPLSPEGLADDYVNQLVLASVREKLRLIGPRLSSPQRGREPAATTEARKALAEVRGELSAVIARQRKQCALWRANCYPTNSLPHRAEETLKLVDELAALPDVATDDEWWCETALSMPEYHMHPYWSILLETDGTWQKIAGGYWKAGMRDWANFERIDPFRFSGRPKRMRIEYHGRGPCSMNYCSVENSRYRYVPKAMTKVEGLVQNAEHLLVDNWKSARFGWPDTLETFNHPEIQDLVSAVEFDLQEIPLK